MLNQCTKVIASVCLIPNLEYNCLIYTFREGTALGLNSCPECCDVCKRDGERKRERQRVERERMKGKER